jgi:hypothetical protein
MKNTRNIKIIIILIQINKIGVIVMNQSLYLGSLTLIDTFLVLLFNY